MLLAAESHKRLETFLREHRGSPGLRLPPLFFHSGRVARWLTQTFHIGAITLGRHIFVLPELVERDGEGRLTVPGWLAAHEATHVLQFERAGMIRFLVSYLGGYWRALRAQKRRDGAGHLQAYLAIIEEGEARKAQEAYAVWRKRAEERPVEDEHKPPSSHTVLSKEQPDKT